MATRSAGGGTRMIVTGVKDIDRRLRRLGTEVQKKVVRQGMRKGMDLVTAEAKSLAPVDTGALRAAIKTRSGRAKRGSFRVLTRVGEGDFKGKTFYAAMIEFGTRRRPARPYMTPAYESKAVEAKVIAIRAILEGIERLASRGGLAERLSSSIAGARKSKAYKGAVRSARKAYKAKAKAVAKGAKRWRKASVKQATRSAKRLRKASNRLAKRTAKRVKKSIKGGSRKRGRRKG